ncbi:MAG: hypothetical protein RL272_374 [Candidatus Parcubacteria bacterium]|jgi:hypothetical protein
MKTPIVGRSALIMGPKYDLLKTLDAYERLIDALAARFGGTAVTTVRQSASRRIPWPDPGKAVARQTWLSMKEIHDVVDEPLVHPMDGLTIKAYLLGKTWCVQDAETGAVTTPEGEDVSALDPVPTVCVYGPKARGGDGHALLDVATVDAVQAVIDGPLADLGLVISRHRFERSATGAPQPLEVAYVTFPHGVYGDGHEWLNVRCVSSDGGDPDPDGLEN